MANLFQQLQKALDQGTSSVQRAVQNPQQSIQTVGRAMQQFQFPDTKSFPMPPVIGFTSPIDARPFIAEGVRSTGRTVERLAEPSKALQTYQKSPATAAEDVLNIAAVLPVGRVAQAGGKGLQALRLSPKVARIKGAIEGISQAVSGVPSKSRVATSFPDTGFQVPSFLTKATRSSSTRYSSPSQVTKTGQSVDFANPSSIQSYITTLQKNSQVNVGAFTENLANATRIKPDVRVKKAESIKGKIDRYLLSGKNPDEIADVLAGRVVVKSHEIERQLQNISQNFNIISVDDFFTNPTKWGYRGINAKVQLPNGTLAEVQIHTPGSLKVATKIHKAYEKWRNLDLTILSPAQKIQFKKDVRVSRQYAERNFAKD